MRMRVMDGADVVGLVLVVLAARGGWEFWLDFVWFWLTGRDGNEWSGF